MVVAIGSACAPDPAVAGDPRYATMHDTLPPAVHEAKHVAAERPDSLRARGVGVRAEHATLTRIDGTTDAWLDFTLVRDPDAATDTITLLMNCNADSIQTLERDGSPVRTAIILLAGTRTTFADGARRVRVHGLRPILPGRASETLVRTARGGDLVLQTPVDDPHAHH
jgi:hypothetical protein